MNRRRFLRALGVGGLGVVGFRQTVPDPSPIAGREFELDPPAVDGLERYDGPPGAERRPPAVEVTDSEHSVEVIGRMPVGSSSCDRAVLERATYHARTDTLHVVVGTGPQREGFRDSVWLGRGCTSDLSWDTYRVRVTMSDELPDTVVVVERAHGDTTTTTFERPTR